MPALSELCPQNTGTSCLCSSRTLSCNLRCRFLHPLFKAQGQPIGKEDVSEGVNAIRMTFRD